MEEKKRLAWFILLRVVVVSVFLVSTIILTVKEPGSLGDETLPGLFRLILATYLFSLVSLVVLRFASRFQQYLTYAQIVWDLQLVTILILLTGGISSPYSFLYILSIINASVLLARKEAVYTASLCAILYGTIIDFQFYGKLAYFGLNQMPAQQHGANYLFYTVFVNILAYYLTAFLTGYLAERARKSESALHKKEIDYEELERLHSSIVFNLDSGLVTLNNENKIRVFNPYATELTGVSQEEAYDTPLTDIVPGITPPYGKQSIRRGEILYKADSGHGKVFGFKTDPLLDKDGDRAGVIIVLQDITNLKRMEAQLKKADRLAAIGELSARIAHEIRNPLASISGSVQLIAQGERVDANDKKLLDIVLRETDRLNSLIRDFLAYARPTQPLKMPIQVRPFFADLTALLHTDPRFENVLILTEFDGDITINADRDQFQQVFWNLLVNAAEALPAGGIIRIAAEVLIGENIDIGINGDMAKISISDNGNGMAREETQRVFEPFFTTKPGGTGLGLATVYRVIETHSGCIQVDSSPGEGTIFTIYLPQS